MPLVKVKTSTSAPKLIICDDYDGLKNKGKLILASGKIYF